MALKKTTRALLIRAKTFKNNPSVNRKKVASSLRAARKGMGAKAHRQALTSNPVYGDIMRRRSYKSP